MGCPVSLIKAPRRVFEASQLDCLCCRLSVFEEITQFLGCIIRDGLFQVVTYCNGLNSATELLSGHIYCDRFHFVHCALSGYTITYWDGFGSAYWVRFTFVSLCNAKTSNIASQTHPSGLSLSITEPKAKDHIAEPAAKLRSVLKPQAHFRDKATGNK